MKKFAFLRTNLLAWAAVVAGLGFSPSHAGNISYNVVIDTSAFSGRSGDIEFQLGGDANNVPVTALFSNYASDAVLNGSTYNLNPSSAPGVTVNGDLISAGTPLILNNDDTVLQVADADQLVTSFGTYLDFHLTLSGVGIGSASPSSASLAISLFDSTGNPLFSGPVETNNAAVFFQSSTDGNVSETQYPLSSVPEPSTLVTMLTGAIGILLFRHRLAIGTRNGHPWKKKRCHGFKKF
jgi:hypothetical protein